MDLRLRDPIYRILPMQRRSLFKGLHSQATSASTEWTTPVRGHVNPFSCRRFDVSRTTEGHVIIPRFLERSIFASRGFITDRHVVLELDRSILVGAVNPIRRRHDRLNGV